MRRLTRTLAAIGAVGALALAGCSDADDDEIVIGVALPQQTSENWVLAEDLFNDGLSDAGYTPIVQFGNSGVTEQQNQIEAMIEQGAQVIVIGSIDGSQLSTQLAAAKAEGIHIIAYDRLLTNTEDVDIYVAFDNFEVGVKQGTALLEGLAERAGDSPWNVELVGGSPDDANSLGFFNGAMSVLEPAINDGTIVIPSGQTTFEQVATQGWLSENVQSRFDTIMSGTYTGIELDGVLSPNDTLARGVLNSVEQAGEATPVITGQDSEVESVRLILEGVQYSTIYKDTRTLVAETIRTVEAYVNGDEPEVNNTEDYDNGVKIVPAYLLEPVIVTQENAVEVYTGDPVLDPVLAEFE